MHKLTHDWHSQHNYNYNFMVFERDGHETIKAQHITESVIIIINYHSPYACTCTYVVILAKLIVGLKLTAYVSPGSEVKKYVILTENYPCMGRQELQISN